jgi:putative ABC transport system ATP-binding protein
MQASRIEPQLSDPAAAAPLLELAGVERRYGAFRPALVGVSLAVRRGEFLLVQGAGASGKSVLLRLMAGLERPSAGSVRVAGEDLARLGPAGRAHMRRSIGYLPPGGGLLAARSVLENVALAPWAAGTARDEGLRRARVALDLVGIDAERSAQTDCGQLPSGERQRVALARALANRPALLLLDDLLAPLDQAAADRVLRLLDPFCDAGVTVIVTQRSDVPATPPLPAPWPARARLLRLQDGQVAP